MAPNGRPTRRDLLDAQLPKLAIALDEAGDPRRLFDPAPAEIWLEIGFGTGEHLAALATAHREIGFLGAEPYINGVASLIARIDEASLANIRLWPDDTRPLLDALPDASLARVFILHPDPWPKTRHAARRIVAPQTLDQLARTMQDGATLRLASDDPGQVAWMLFQLGRHPGFAWTARRPQDWRERPADWPETRYETKTRAAGRRPAYLQYERCPRA